MTDATFVQPDSSAQAGTNYKTKIDAAIRVLAQRGAAFSVHEQSTPDMTLRVEAGVLRHGTTIVEVAAQNTDTITAPSADPRIDVVYLNPADGTVGVATGSAASSPAVPTVPAGMWPLEKVALTVGMTTITNAALSPLRPALGPVRIASQAEAEAGTTPNSIMTPERTAQAIAALTTSEDQVARDLGITALIEATATGGIRGDVVSWVADTDNFSTKTGATFATDHYHNPAAPTAISQGAGTPIGNMTNGGGLAAAYDGTVNNQAGSALSSNTGNASFSGYNNANGKDWGGGVTKTVVKVVLKAPTDVQGFGLYGSMTWKLQGSADGSAWTDLYTGTALPANTTSAVVTVDTGITTTTAYRYHRINVNGDGSNYIGFAEIEFSEPGTPPDMLLSDDAATVAADADTVDVYVTEKAVDASPTREIKASIDGGSTYSAAGTLQKTFTVGDKQMHRYSCDVSAQTGTSLKVTYDSLDDGKEREVYRLDALPIYP